MRLACFSHRVVTLASERTPQVRAGRRRDRERRQRCKVLVVPLHRRVVLRRARVRVAPARRVPKAALSLSLSLSLSIMPVSSKCGERERASARRCALDQSDTSGELFRNEPSLQPISFETAEHCVSRGDVPRYALPMLLGAQPHDKLLLHIGRSKRHARHGKDRVELEILHTPAYVLRTLLIVSCHRCSATTAAAHLLHVKLFSSHKVVFFPVRRICDGYRSDRT